MAKIKLKNLKFERELFEKVKKKDDVSIEEKLTFLASKSKTAYKEYYTCAAALSLDDV